MSTAVGHADLTSRTLKLVEGELRAQLERTPGRAPGLVCAGAGVPVAFGRAVRELIVVTPTQEMVPAPLSERDRVAVGTLLTLAHQVRLLAYDPLTRRPRAAVVVRATAATHRSAGTCGPSRTSVRRKAPGHRSPDEGGRYAGGSDRGLAACA
ncbi:hypothetical protein [Streptomyces sp. S.PB5]|uniref:hypothetical protein n=1 Tax=Streptomyces sp. S.PB5 TaxID=3020844 RepID=UPI0025B24774|nr:hypothetical protein [Streptomyces sp. S.PB5]MDN3029010.1 hypothetical protein [Streptomyces sp. S.PB5]